MAKTNDTDLSEILQDVGNGKIQLPDFQRPWTWECGRIKRLLASLSLGYPMGAIMCLERGNPNLNFKYRPLEGVENPPNEPLSLVLDGQQRLTSIYQATSSSKPVVTFTEKKDDLRVYYYFDMRKCLDPQVDREDAIEVLPADKIRRVNFNRDIELDLSSSEKEYRQLMFPANAIFNKQAPTDWLLGLAQCPDAPADALEVFKQFKIKVLDVVDAYELPIITLDRETPRSAVCTIFENVNTGGVPLTVFELVTASFAAENFDLPKCWKEECLPSLKASDEPVPIRLFEHFDKTQFVTTVALYVSYKKKMTTGTGFVSCKRKDVLDLTCEEFKANYKTVLSGFKMARTFLMRDECIYQENDMPYMTQVTPLAAICAWIGETKFGKPEVKRILSRWYWSGVLGEMYGSANEGRFANDIVDVVDEIEGRQSEQRTVRDATFSAVRLTTMRSRQSAAYKGVMALLYKAGCKDFVGGYTMDLAHFLNEVPDIHHIFPKTYCEKTFDLRKVPEMHWNSIVNKTPISYQTNRSIGGAAPSKYVAKLLKADPDSLTHDKLMENLASHGIDTTALCADDYPTYFIARAKHILNLIETAMDKKVSDRSSDEVVKKFGASLSI